MKRFVTIKFDLLLQNLKIIIKSWDYFLVFYVPSVVDFSEANEAVSSSPRFWAPNCFDD